MSQCCSCEFARNKGNEKSMLDKISELNIEDQADHESKYFFYEKGGPILRNIKWKIELYSEFESVGRKSLHVFFKKIGRKIFFEK